MKKGKGYSLQQREVKEIVPVIMSEDEKAKKALLLSIFGAFDYFTGIQLDDSNLNQIFLETTKTLAIIAEQAEAGAGQILLDFVASLESYSIFLDLVLDVATERGVDFESKEELLSIAQEIAPDLSVFHERLLSERNCAMKVYPEIEALLIYGQRLSDLDEKNVQLCKLYPLLDELGHFSRIMDVDFLLKKKVGEFDAGNPRIVRMLYCAQDFRHERALSDLWPVPTGITVERANYKNPNHPNFSRVNKPYATAAVYSSVPGLARDVIDIFRSLIAQHPIEVVVGMLEDWVMRGELDPDLSICAIQVHNDGERLLLKAIGLGEGLIIINNDEKIFFEKKASVGDYQRQTPLKVVVRELDYNQHYSIEVFAVQDKDKVTEKGRPNFGKAGRVVNMNSRRDRSVIEVVKPFVWTAAHIAAKIKSPMGYYLSPLFQTATLHFGQIHGDRNPGDEQAVGCQIARELKEFFTQEGITVTEAKGMIDEYHVIDRINVVSYLDFLSLHYGEEVKKATFESSLLIRHLADELIMGLIKTRPECIHYLGGNVYLQIADDMVIELYNGIGANKDLCGRVACVPYAAAFEVERSNPELANALYRDMIFENYPDSLLAKLWKEFPELSLDELIIRQAPKPEDRMKIKRQIDQEIDKSFLEKTRLETNFVEKILSQTETSKQIHLDILEGPYDEQHRKMSAFMAQSGILSSLNVFRVSFDGHSGRLDIMRC